MPTGTDSKLDVTADDAMRKVEQSDKVALVGAQPGQQTPNMMR